MLVLAILLSCAALPDNAWASGVAAAQAALPWWGWSALLFALCLAIGALGVVGGIGGGVLFVALVGGFFPFHIDFVRGAGLLVALAGALAAGPGLLRAGMADLRLALPAALVASAMAIVGALIGLALPGDAIYTALGLTILAIVTLMWRARKVDYPAVRRMGNLARSLRLAGVYRDPSIGRDVWWKVHRTRRGYALFAGIGLIAGMFGIGAGWANVPVLNLVMGAPLKVAVGTSKFLLSVTDTAAAWVYINQGAVLPMIAVPSVVGMMLGARIGARLLNVLKGSVIRRLVIGVLLFAGARALLKGAGVWP